MKRRTFLEAGAGLGLPSWLAQSQERPLSHRVPATDNNYKHVRSYIEERPIAGYQWASQKAYEAFQDIKYGVRIHWGLYAIPGKSKESWPFLDLSFEERRRYNELYKTWNPSGFDADEWTNLFAESGLKMFAFTTKHHEGFSMFDTRTRVRRRVDWTAGGGPKMEDCDLAYSIMETPFRRDIVKELCAAARKRNIKIDLYFSHPDWYDADFRPYGFHPLQTPSSPALNGWRPSDGSVADFWQTMKPRLGDHPLIVPDPSPEEVRRMLKRHRDQLVELLTNYGSIDMMCLDIYLGPKVWPQLRETILELRKIQPDLMLRARGIGNYGDYFTPERVVPQSKENTAMPWFVIYPLGSSFSYEREPKNYKGPGWIVRNLVDSVAKGGNFMVGVGPGADGRFHPVAIEQLKQAGAWLKVNGEGIYTTRARDASGWSQGDNIRFTRSKDGRSVYCFLLEWPGKSVPLKSFPEPRDVKINLLGYSKPLQWRRDPSQGLIVDIPEFLQDEKNRPCGHAWCLQIVS